MDDLSKFKFENLTEETVKEIKDLSVEQLKQLKGEKGTLIIRNKKTGQKGQSNYGNLIVLESLSMRKRYDVIGFQTSKVKTELPIGKRVQQVVQDAPYVEEFIAPEVPLINESNDLEEHISSINEIVSGKPFEEIEVNAAEEVVSQDHSLLHQVNQPAEDLKFENFGSDEEKAAEVVVEKQVAKKPVAKKPAAPRRKMNRK